jgi:ABC-type multidrug transport system fused ATPase/permease subunit
LEKGEIAESGHPEDLLRMKDGLYASIAREQGITTSMETAM